MSLTVQGKKELLDDNRALVSEALEPEITAATIWFRNRGTLSPHQAALIAAESTPLQKADKLLDLLVVVDDGWDALLAYLKAQNHTRVAEKLGGIIPEVLCIQSLRKSYREAFGFVQMIKYTEPINIDDAFVELAWQRQGGKRETLGSYIEAIPILRGKRYPLMILEGKPGYGKTTFAHKICYDWASREIPDLQQYAAVCVLKLRQFSKKCSTLKEGFIHLCKASVGDTVALPTIFEDERPSLWILDGLDEYSDGMCKELDRILAPPNLETPPVLPGDVIITTRPHAMSRVKTGYLHFSLVGLSEIKRKEYVHKYMVDPTISENLLTAISEKPRLSEVAESPLILRMNCLVFDRKGKLPQTLAELYSQMCDWLLDHAKQKGRKFRRYRTWTDVPVIKNVCALALNGLLDSASGVLVFSEKELSDFGVGVEASELGIINVTADLMKGNQVSSFPHKSFQEFFASYLWFQKPDMRRRLIDRIKMTHRTGLVLRANDCFQKLFTMRAALLEAYKFGIECASTDNTRFQSVANVLEMLQNTTTDHRSVYSRGTDSTRGDDEIREECLQVARNVDANTDKLIWTQFALSLNGLFFASSHSQLHPIILRLASQVPSPDIFLLDDRDRGNLIINIQTLVDHVKVVGLNPKEVLSNVLKLKCDIILFLHSVNGPVGDVITDFLYNWDSESKPKAAFVLEADNFELLETILQSDLCRRLDCFHVELVVHVDLTAPPATVGMLENPLKVVPRNIRVYLDFRNSAVANSPDTTNSIFETVTRLFRMCSKSWRTLFVESDDSAWELPITTGFVECVKLCHYLHLENVTLSSPSLDALLDFVSQASILRRLYIIQCPMSDEVALALATGISNISSLEELTLNVPKASQQALITLFDSVSQLTNLKELVIVETKMMSDGSILRKAAEEIGKCPALTALYFEHCGLDDSNMEQLLVLLECLARTRKAAKEKVSVALVGNNFSLANQQLLSGMTSDPRMKEIMKGIGAIFL